MFVISSSTGEDLFEERGNLYHCIQQWNIPEYSPSMQTNVAIGLARKVKFSHSAFNDEHELYMEVSTRPIILKTKLKMDPMTKPMNPFY